MRLTATIINVLIFSALVASCTPKPNDNMREELAKLKGPDTGSVGSTIESQAQQAVTDRDYKRAAQFYKQLLDMNPHNKGYVVAYADNLRRIGENKEALITIDKFLAKDPNDVDALEVRGLVLMNMGEFNDAGKEFDHVMQVDGKRWRTLNAIGILFAIKKMNPQAMQYYNAALKADPYNPGVLNNLGLALAMEQQYEKAVATLQDARNHVPNGSAELKHIDLDLALVYAIAGQLDAAEQVASQHLSKSALYNNMGFYAYIAKNPELAKGYLNMAMTQEPVYYERAWKNLNAIAGDVGREPGLQNSIDNAPAAGADEAAKKPKLVNKENNVRVEPDEQQSGIKEMKPEQDSSPLFTAPAR